MQINRIKNALFIECIEALGENVDILSEDDSNKIFDLFKRRFPLTKWGKIEWSSICNSASLPSQNNIVNYLTNLLQTSIDPTVYVFWDNAKLPVIKTNIYSVITHFEDVAVNYTWIFNPIQGYVIEALPSGLHIGVINLCIKND